MVLSLKKIFYVYVYLDPRKPGLFRYGEYKFDYEPFYVGKGHGNRYKQFLVSKSSLVKNKINKIKREINDNPFVRVIISDLIEKKAFDMEKCLIEAIGRNDLHLGPLLNLSNGGEGDAGWMPSLECRKNRSIALKKAWKDLNSRLNSVESRKQRTKINLARWQDPNSGFHSPERRVKIIKANRRAHEDPNHYINSVEYREKLSIRTKRYWKDPNNKIHSEECKKRRSASIKKAWGKTETIEKSSMSHKNLWADSRSGYNSKQCRIKMANAKAMAWIVIRPDGTKIKIFNLCKFCRENDLDVSAMHRIASRKPHNYQHKGWKCRYISEVSQ